MADYKSKKAGNHLGRAWRGAARRGGRLYQGQVPGTTPCRHHLSEDKFLRPARNSTWCRRSGCRCVSRAAGTPAAWKASECLVEDHLWRSSGARGGATVHVGISATDLRRSIAPIGSRRVVHRGSRHESTPMFRERSLCPRCALLFFPEHIPSPPPPSTPSRRFLAS